MPNQMNIGIPPYIQNNSSGDTMNLNTFDPETGTEMQAINRKQQIANLLVQQSLAPRQGGMVGNVYVPAGLGQGAAQLGQALAGAYMTHKNDKARAGLESQNQQNVANAMTAYQESQQGKPVLTVPEGSQGPERPEMPATPETQQQGLARLMASQNPAVMRFAQYEAQRKAKEAEMATAQRNALAIEAAKANSAAALKGVPSVDEQNKLAQHQQDRTTLSAIDQANLDQHKTDRVTIPAVDQLRIDAENKRAAEKLAEEARQHNTPSGTALSQIDAQGALQNASLQQRQAEFEQKKANDIAQLELEKGKAGFAEKKLALDAQHQQEQLALQREMHNTPSGNALLTTDAQAAMQNATLAQRQTEFDQKVKQDQAELDFKKKQGVSDQEIKRQQIAMQDRHQKEQEKLTKEGHAIQERLGMAQQARQNEPNLAEGYRWADPAHTAQEKIPGSKADDKVEQAQAKVTTGHENVDKITSTLRGYYDDLNKGGGITNATKGTMDNLSAAASSSWLGKAVGHAVGTRNQAARDKIAETRPMLMQAIMQATGMSAKQMDSNTELKMWLQTATDPDLEYGANKEALDHLDDMFGLGIKQPAAPSGGGVQTATAAPVPGAKAEPAKIASDADYNALPSGAVFIAPDGKQRRKP